MIKEIVLEKVSVKSPPSPSTHTFGKDMRSVYYDLGDKIYGLESLAKTTKDTVIKLYAKKMIALHNSFRKHLDEKYEKWD